MPAGLSRPKQVDVLNYCSLVALTTTEADLGTPAQVFEEQVFLEATGQVATGGSPATSTVFIALQTDLGDGLWVDLAWYVSTSAANRTDLFCFQTGPGQANAVLQRKAGTPPSGTKPAAIELGLGSRYRITGQATFTGGTSPSAVASVRTVIY